MLPLILAFPLILCVGFGIAYRLHGRAALTGAFGLLLYVALLAVPVFPVMIEVITLRTDWQPLTPAWVAGGALVGVGLFGGCWLLASRRTSAVWVGLPGWPGYLHILGIAALIVTCEEIVWRGYLIPALGEYLTPLGGLVAAAVAFALNHAFFGVRQVLVTFVAGLIWGALVLLEGQLWAALASHFVYDALVWTWLRHQVPPSFNAPETGARTDQ